MFIYSKSHKKVEKKVQLIASKITHITHWDWQL